MVEQADTADLKSADVSREGSSPSGGTADKEAFMKGRETLDI